jgi:hypothetical protein
MLSLLFTGADWLGVFLSLLVSNNCWVWRGRRRGGRGFFAIKAGMGPLEDFLLLA